MKEQSKAERIASELDLIEATLQTCGVIHKAAFELRRLHAENERLREAVLAEREACAKACEHVRDFFSGTSLAVDYENHSPSNSLAYTQCAAAIRARGET